MSDVKERSILAFVSEFKEVGAAVGLIIGGFIWILGYFATKADLESLHKRTQEESEKIHCMLRLNVEWLAGEQLWKLSYDELARVESQLRGLAPRPESVPDPATLPQIVALERRRSEISSDLEAARIQKNDSRSRLMRGECTRG